VQGRIRTRIALADGGDEALAELSRRKGRAGRAEDRDGGDWDVAVTDDGVVVTRDGVTPVTVEGGELRVAGRTLGWALYPDGPRTLEITAPDGSPLLRAAPGADDEPWAAITFAPELPEPLPVVLAACFALLRAEPQVGASFLDALPDLPLP
jgi:hypothetical protein